MRSLFDFIKAFIEANILSGPDPFYRTIEPFNDQIFKANNLAERKTRGFRSPAVFIEFNEVSTNRRAFAIKDVELQVIFHFSFEGYKHFGKRRAFDTFDFLDTFDNAIARLVGKETDTVQFGSLEQELQNNSEDNDNIDTPVLTYITMWRNNKSNRRTGIEKDGVIEDVTGEIL